MTSDHSPQVVAIVDDDQSIQRALKDLMESAELLARCYGSAEEFLESQHRSEIACLVADVRMPGMSGLELQARLKLEGARIPMIFITAHSDAKLKTEAMNAGAVDFLFKPFDDEVLLDKVRTALED
jgi:FixJ family two-component response regulator